MENRRLSQIISLLLLHSSWGPELKWLCTPVLSCHSCALSWFACPVGVLVHYSGYHLFPYFALGTVVLLGVLVGRLLCGWACPFGFLQDMLYKIPTPKITLPRWASSVKYLVLILLVFLLPFLFGEDTQYSFCRICPASLVQVTLPNVVSSGFSTISTGTVVKLSVFVVVIALAALSSRAFCKTMCPIGTILAVFNLFSFWTVKIPKGECVSCRQCDRACPTNVLPSSRIAEGIPPNRSLDCVVCHDCQSVCPKREEDAAA